MESVTWCLDFFLSNYLDFLIGLHSSALYPLYALISVISSCASSSVEKHYCFISCIILHFLSFLFPGLYSLWVVCLLPFVLFAGFLYFVFCLDLFLDSGLEFLDLTFASPAYPSLLATFIVFMFFSFSMFEFLIWC